MTPAQHLFRWHRQVTGGPRRRGVDAPRILFTRKYMRVVDGRAVSCDQGDATELFRTWHAPHGRPYWLVNSSTIRRPA